MHPTRIAAPADRQRATGCEAAGAIVTALSVVVSNYNGREVLPATLAALQEIDGLDLEVIVVDDGSTDGSREWAEAAHGWCRIIALGRNTQRLNVVRNRGLKEASRRFVFLMDNDIIVNESSLREMLRVMHQREGAVICTPRLLYVDDISTIYQDGGALHFLCVTAGCRRGAPARQESAPARPTIGGGIMLIDLERAASMGLFDEALAIGWGDDGEFQVRARLHGLECLHVPTAAFLHVERPHARTRIYGQLVNRHRILFTMYSRRTLLLLGPALLGFEACLFAAALVGGFADQYVNAWRTTLRSRTALRDRRSALQRARVRPDSAYLDGGCIVPGRHLHRSRVIGAAAAAVTAVLDGYWRLVRRWL